MAIISGPATRPYGQWDSLIEKGLLASADNDLVDCFAYNDSGTTTFCYLESRASEGGRCVIVRDVNGDKEDILDEQLDAQSKVHEYGRAAVTQTKDGRLIFVDADSQAVYYLDPKTKEVHLVYQESGSRFAGFDELGIDGKTWIVAVHEKPDEQYNGLVLIEPTTLSIITKISGADFYTTPKFSPDGKWLSWLQWDLEDMPWTGAQLFVAQFQDNQFINHRRIAGEPLIESISQPRWGLDGNLYFVSDRTGYYKLYKMDTKDFCILPVGTGGLDNYEEIEFSSPEWKLGARTYGFLSPNLIVAAYLYQAGSGLALINLDKNEWTELPTAYVEISYINIVSSTRFLLCGAMPDSPKEIVELDIHDSSYRRVIAASTSLKLSRDIFSVGKSIVFPRSNASKGYAWLWSPHNSKFIGPSGELPPLIVQVHGGPTSHVGSGLDLMKQYWTSRGYAYASVNYGGSSGYGRKYRDDLNGKWGELDASDAASFAEYMCSEECPLGIRASRGQVGITGWSAGGYTVLRALTLNTFPWKAGVSLYGIGNITLLEQDTHKFESRYTRILFDPPGEDLTDEERSKLYHDKSPQYFASNITAATLLLQGSEDKVVPLNQAEEMKNEIEKAGQVAKLVVYQGEGHGFRKAESIKDMLDQMEQWWSKYLAKS